MLVLVVNARVWQVGGTHMAPDSHSLPCGQLAARSFCGCQPFVMRAGLRNRWRWGVASNDMVG
jgi:hypothetical protein